jgi:hypothetical protein
MQSYHESNESYARNAIVYECVADSRLDVYEDGQTGVLHPTSPF